MLENILTVIMYIGIFGFGLGFIRYIIRAYEEPIGEMIREIKNIDEEKELPNKNKFIRFIIKIWNDPIDFIMLSIAVIFISKILSKVFYK